MADTRWSPRPRARVGPGPPPECVARRLPRECRGRGAVEVSRGAPRGRASALPGRPSRAWGTGWPPRGRRGSGSGRGGRGTTRAPACPGDPARVTFAVWWTRETGAGQSSPSLPLLKEKGTSANLANTCGAPSPVSPHPGQCGLREWLWILFSCFSQVLEIPSPGRWG